MTVGSALNQYETVFILTPVLSDVQMKEAVEKFKGILTAEGAEIVNEETDNALVTTEVYFQFLNDSRFCIELNQLIETG